MKFEINFEQSPEYVTIQTEGDASVDGFDELLTGIVESPEWTAGAKQLVDHRKLTNIGMLSSEDVGQIMGIVKKHSKALGQGRCAFVVSDALGFGLTRMYGGIGGNVLHQEVAVFYTMEEAAEWLKR